MARFQGVNLGKFMGKLGSTCYSSIMKSFIYFIGLFALSLTGAASGSAQAEPIRVAAAASMRTSLGEIAALYTEQSGVVIQLSFASSGTLSRQIARGAPFDLFLSADEGFVDDIANAGLTQDKDAIYAQGRLALIVGKQTGIAPDTALRDVDRYFKANPDAHFAIANAGHVPYGRAAREALMSLGRYDRIAPRLVFGENVAQAAQFVVGGSAVAGLVSLSMALTPVAMKTTSHIVLPSDLHTPINHRMVVLRRADKAANGLFAFILSPPARSVLTRHGFTVPES